MSDWFEDDAFWREMKPYMFDEARWTQGAEQVDAAVGLLGLAPGAHVLDLCCGPGRHSVALVARGFRVTGVDLNEAYLASLRAREPAVETVHADMREFRRERAFDGAINLFSSFGYFEDPADDARVLANVRASLRPGGRLLLDLMGKEVLAAKFEPRRWHQHDDGSILLEHRTLRDDWRFCDAHWILLRGDRRDEFRFTTRLFSGDELSALLRAAGFADVTLLGWYDGRPYDHEARRLLAVAAC